MSITVGVVGAGHIATSRHIPAFQNHSQTSVEGVYDKTDDVARSVASEFDVNHYETLDGVTESCDLISICTPPEAHASLAIEAMNDGCHVLTEKPMTMSVPEATEMMEVAERNNRVLSVVHNMQFMQSVRRAKQLATEYGGVNRARAFAVKRSNMNKDYLDEGADPEEWGSERFWDESPHMHYLFEEFLGELELQDTTLDYGERGYSHVAARYTSDMGTEARLTITWDSPVSEWWLVLFCENGLIMVDLYRDIVLNYGRERDHDARAVITMLLSTLRQLGTGGFGAGIRYLRDVHIKGYGIPDSGFSRQVDLLVKALRNDTEPPVPGSEGRRILQYMSTVAVDSGMSDYLDIESSASSRTP